MLLYFLGWNSAKGSWLLLRTKDALCLQEERSMSAHTVLPGILPVGDNNGYCYYVPILPRRRQQLKLLFRHVLLRYTKSCYNR
jgi:hypothetical protein